MYMTQAKHWAIKIIVACLFMGLVALTGCGGDETDPVANDPLAPTVAAGESSPVEEAGEAGGGGLGENPVEGDDIPTENSAVTGVNPLGEEAGEGEEGGTGATATETEQTGTEGTGTESGTGSPADGQAAASNMLPSISFNTEGQDQSLAEWAADVDTRNMDAVTPTADMSDAQVLPGYVDAHFGSYPTGDQQRTAHIYVFPVAQFEENNETAAAEIEALRQLLDERPDTPDGPLPYLPLSTTEQQQAVQAQVEYLDFEGGSGVRYITQYTNEGEITPINSDQLVYTFQGLTADGMYYVAAVFPVGQSELPAADVPAPGTFTEDYAGYLEQTTSQLNEADPASFDPDLNMLDALIRSIILEYPTGDLDSAYPAVPEDDGE